MIYTVQITHALPQQHIQFMKLNVDVFVVEKVLSLKQNIVNHNLLFRLNILMNNVCISIYQTQLRLFLLPPSCWFWSLLHINDLRLKSFCHLASPSKSCLCSVAALDHIAALKYWKSLANTKPFFKCRPTKACFGRNGRPVVEPLTPCCDCWL